MALPDLQRDFFRAMRYDPAPADVLRHFRGSARLNSVDCLSIYRRMYWLRQVNALTETFPKLRSALEEQGFVEFCCRYIREHPSRSPALECLGRKMPEFAGQHLPEFAELVSLEWERNRVLIAPESPQVCRASDVQPELFAEARLGFVPSLGVVQVGADLLARYFPASCSGESGVGRADVAVWRGGFAVRQLVLRQREAQAFRCALSGLNMGQVLAEFGGGQSAVSDAFQMVAGWFGRGWISSIDV